VESNCISDLVWSRLGVEQAELSEIAVDREVFQVLWILPTQPSLEAELSEIAVDREVFQVLWILPTQPSLGEKRA